MDATTLHCGTGLESDAELDAYAAAVLEAASRHEHPMLLELHRATITQDARRTLDLTERFPDLRFNADLSHWYTGHEMTYGDFGAKLDRLGPVLSRVRFLQSDAVVTLANVFGTFIPVDVANNPDLKPEKADIRSAGAVFERGTLRVSADYWRYKFTDLITDEPLNSVLAAGFPAAGGACIGDPAFVASRFEFSGGCSSGTLTKVITSKINGPGITTSGVDVLADYRLTGVAGGSLGLGGSVTYVEKYRVSALEIGGVPVPGSAFDGVGKANFGTIAYPLPRWKATGYLEFERGAHSIRWDGRFTDSYEDQRAGLFLYSSANQTASAAACGGPTTTSPRPTVSSPECGTATRGQTIKSILLHDLTYRAEITDRTTLVLNVANVLDSDPPFARTELSYDALTGDPLGRTFRLSIRQRF